MMNDSSDRLSRKSQLERELNYNEFLLAVLDDRDTISDTLIDKSTALEVQCFGFRSDHYEPPAALDHLIPPFSPMSIDMTATRHSDGSTTVSRLDFYPEDGSPFSINQQDAFALARHSGEQYLLPADCPIAALRQLIPYEFREQASPDQMLTYINRFSPESNNLLEYSSENDDFRGIVRFCKIETLDDTTDRLEIIKYFQHPSNAEVGTRMLLSESLKTRSQADNPDQAIYELTIDSIYRESANEEEFTVESILNAGSRVTPVTLATRRHLNDIADVLKTLDIPLAAIDIIDDITARRE
jgi:hypothetical protein